LSVTACYLNNTGQYKALTKHARKTNPIERFNNMLRQRAARLARYTLALSKTVEHHISTIRGIVNLMDRSLT